MERPGGREAGLGVGAVAQRLGVAASTLRTWDRRYGIGPSGRSPGGHRRYTPSDLARLAVMQRQILAGVPPGEAARVALDEPPGEPAPRAHGAGGRRVPLAGTAAPPRAAAVRGLARAAMALDQPAMAGTVRDALRRDGVAAAWDGLIVPVLAGIGRKHRATGECVEVEHLLSTVLLGCLAELTTPSGAADGRPVLLACAPEEQHSLPVYALAAALAEAGVPTRILGARVPPTALAAAIRRAGPGGVFIWSQTAETGEPTWLDGLPPSRPPYRLVVGGPGWARGRLPASAALVGTIPEAVAELISLPSHS
ncbi:MerR family transcriptional regulator [Actinomadura graeca]|uniref:MerR family transcriptional regulator n=1 Tax=Actinomadura graeca TaxID=2750812 RepID=A0ABX8QU68_9ACTN|nr:MerR family transcriptional regulator [Actinomadura graeca]QXJ22275.1 MerR family transcriptional regulator [Actinomadura graeca]